MRVLVQWARNQSSDWEEYDSAFWSSIPAKSRPGPGSSADSVRGWINAINIQGTVFEGDDYYVEHLSDTLVRVTVVTTESDAFSGPYARVVEFPSIGPRIELGGAYSTNPTQIIYTDEPSFYTIATYNTQVRPWSEFIPPNASLARFGKTLPDPVYANHVSGRTIRGWREWSDGIPEALISKGLVRIQRSAGLYNAPKGTRTYYMNNAAGTSLVHSADLELTLGTSPAGVSTASTGNISSLGETVLWAVTPSGEPDSSAWPTGNYRYQMDVLSAGADIIYGLTTVGSGVGHFARVDGTLGLDLQTHPQQEGTFIFAGLWLATTGSVNWTAGSATDRFEVLVAAQRTGGMGNQSLIFELGEADDFADGPWAAAAVAQTDPFMGCNF